jgi:hypothetical protein
MMSLGLLLLDHQVHGNQRNRERRQRRCVNRTAPNPPSASEQARHSVGVGGQPELGLRSDEG